jgi:hypothetical protein
MICRRKPKRAGKKRRNYEHLYSYQARDYNSGRLY